MYLKNPLIPTYGLSIGLGYFKEIKSKINLGEVDVTMATSIGEHVTDGEKLAF